MHSSQLVDGPQSDYPRWLASILSSFAEEHSTGRNDLQQRDVLHFKHLQSERLCIEESPFMTTTTGATGIERRLQFKRLGLIVSPLPDKFAPTS